MSEEKACRLFSRVFSCTRWPSFPQPTWAPGLFTVNLNLLCQSQVFRVVHSVPCVCSRPTSSGCRSDPWKHTSFKQLCNITASPSAPACPAPPPANPCHGQPHHSHLSQRIFVLKTTFTEVIIILYLCV